jgi:hypothetical protein
MNAFLIGDGIGWHALLAVAAALLVFFGGGWLLHRVAQWIESKWNTLELAGTPLCQVSFKDWVALSLAVVLCTLAFLLTFVPLMPFFWLRERWLARTYYVELAPVRK